jgi:hypothetical protein
VPTRTSLSKMVGSPHTSSVPNVEGKPISWRTRCALRVDTSLSTPNVRCAARRCPSMSKSSVGYAVTTATLPSENGTDDG